MVVVCGGDFEWWWLFVVMGEGFDPKKRNWGELYIFGNAWESSWESKPLAIVVFLVVREGRSRGIVYFEPFIPFEHN